MTPATPAHPLPPARWRQDHTGAFVTRRDQRQLLVIEHPWQPSRTGRYGQWQTRVAAPAGWQPGQPLFVSFYQSDNYSGDWMPDTWTGAQVFVGHRFKQLLVNGQVVWEEDVADEQNAGVVELGYRGEPGRSGFSDPYRLVEITGLARKQMVLTLRVVDKVSSATRLPGDHYQRFSWSAHDPRQVKDHFHTAVYFGDVHLSSSGQVVRPALPPVVAKAQDQGAGVIPKAGIPLRLLTRGKLPAPGYPVRTGVPLPRGQVAAGTPFALRDARGKAVPLVARETSHWPDGSLRWVLCEFVARRGGRYRLVPGVPSPAPAQPVQVQKRGRTLRVGNGLLELKLSTATGPGVFAGLACKGGLDLGGMDFQLKLNRVGWRDTFRARRRRLVVESRTPLCAVLRLEGDMVDEQGQRFGPWCARLELWAGLPYLLVAWRLVNESDQAMAMLLDWSAKIALPDLSEALVDFGPFAPGFDPEDIGVKAMGHRGEVAAPRRLTLHRSSELSCRQERADQARLYRNTTWVATAPQAAGFLHLQHAKGGLTGAMRWFAEEFPKGLVVRPDALKLATLPEYEDALAWPHDRPFVRLGRGEAKQQVFALWLHQGGLPAGQTEAFNRCVQDAPRLFDSAWFTGTGAIETGPPRHHPTLAGWAREVAPAIERTGIGAPRLGHREYWDTAWSNDYRGRTHLGLIQFLETGDPRWLRYFDAACVHNREVDIIHFCPKHPEWVGASHAYGEDHTSCGPMGNIGSNCDGLLDHYLLTGDPDSLEAARGYARRLLDCNPWGRSAREVGWPLAQVSRWYGQTGDRRFLHKARELLAVIRAYVEPRRGVFSEIHGSWSYRGAVPFMTGYLAFGLIRYHQLTNDPEALHLLRLLAGGLFAEARTARGRFTNSPFPEINLPGGKHRFSNGLIGGLAGYLYLVTGETRCGEWARECYEGIVQESADPQLSMDMLPIAGWMLRAVAARKKR
ncbi:MAG: hypothetical protein IT369_01200 [Candidatus Latescibacteria bacterium]|nr:hypothetical protein [Candidatus Latescibacterota bacterium]